MLISRVWAMPCSATLEIPVIRGFVLKYLADSKRSVDPFSGNQRLATYTNDLNPDTAAEYHLEATEFLKLLQAKEVNADLVIFDPPYSNAQISRSYKNIGRAVTMQDTQNGHLYSSARDAMMKILTPEATVLSFGWNSCGMGKNRCFEIIEIMLVAHGGAHNDTICMAERRLSKLQESPELLLDF